MKLNQEQIDQALRQVGIIVTATGLITGLLDLAQLPAGAAITLLGWFLVILGAEEKHDDT